MWVCPKCGRSFKRQCQTHFCAGACKTIDEYIEKESENAQAYLITIRDILKKAMPDAQEKISWLMPNFWKGRSLIQFAAFKNHVSLFVGDEAVKLFSERLKDYYTNKGTIQFQYSQELPVDLIYDIALWCYENKGK